jgi:hypothetical protein
MESTSFTLLLIGVVMPSFQFICTAGAICALLLGAAYGATTRRGLTLMVAGVLLSWAPVLIHAIGAEMATERAGSQLHEPLRAERRAHRP